MTKPETVAVTFYEGGEWEPFPIQGHVAGDRLVHSIRFDDGSEWDTFNGWRRLDASDNTGA